MFIDWETFYHKDMLQNDLYTKCNSNPIATWQTDSKFYLAMQRSKYSQDCFEEEQMRRP